MRKIIAGAGVFICDECVGLCDDIIAEESAASPEDVAARRPAFENRPASEVLELLPALLRSVESVEAELRHSVMSLRAAGTPWEEIADRLGLEAGAARERFERA